MPMEMLVELTRNPLPRSFAKEAEIDLVLMCQTAGYIDAYIPATAHSGRSDERIAIVHRIRPQGYVALANFFRESERGPL